MAQLFGPLEICLLECITKRISLSASELVQMSYSGPDCVFLARVRNPISIRNLCHERSEAFRVLYMIANEAGEEKVQERFSSHIMYVCMGVCVIDLAQRQTQYELTENNALEYLLQCSVMTEN